MLKIIIVGMPDDRLQDLMNAVDSNTECRLQKKMYTAYQVYSEYKVNEADIVFLDSRIPDGNILVIAKKIREIDQKVLIVGVDTKKDELLMQKLKATIPYSDYILKTEDNKKNLELILSRHSLLKANQVVINTYNTEKSKGKNILVIDDFENTLNIVKFTLEKAGYTVETATSAREAIQKLEKGFLPTVIVTDLNMPQMNGFDFIKTIRNMGLATEAPVFVLTTEFSLSRKMEAKQLNVAGWIQKPYNISEFIKIIEAAIK